MCITTFKNEKWEYCLFHILGVIKWIFKRFMFYLPNAKSWMLIFIWYIQKGHQFCGVTIVLYDMICATHDSSFHEAKGSIRDLLISPSPVESSPVLYLQRGEWSWRGLSGLQFPTLTYKLFFCLCNSKMCKYIYNIYIRCPLSNLHAIHHSTLHWLS